MKKNDQAISDQINKLSERLLILRHEYYVLGRSYESDQTYDRLFDQLQSLEQQYPQFRRADSPTLRVGSDLSSDFPEAAHTIPVLSLDKAYAEDTLRIWMQRIETRVGQKLSFVIEEKIDGVSIVLYYEKGMLVRAVTRGNGYIGNDVTANVKTIRSVPLHLQEDVTIAVRGEIYLAKGDFAQLNESLETPYANPRNLAAGTLRRIRSSEAAKVPLNIFVYEGFFADDQLQPDTHKELLVRLSQLGFRLNPHMYICTSGDTLVSYLERSTREREDLPYEIDGLVVKVNELAIREVLGYTGHHPRWAIAYKFEAPLAESVVNAVDVQIGRTGRATPVARVNPVRIGGSTVSNVTLHNQDYIAMLELAVGDSVSVSKRGDVIPAVERVIEKNEAGNRVWKMPDKCPSCGSPLIKQGAHHFCMNHDCPDQVFGRLTFFVGKGQMDIEGLGSETISTLIRKKMVSDVADIYMIDYGVLEQEPGFGSKKIKQIRESVQKSLQQPYSTVLRSLGIPEVGKKAVELLIDHGITSVDELIAISRSRDKDRLLEIKGFGEKTAAAIIREFSDHAVIERIASLRALGLSFEKEKKETASFRQTFAGEVWCVTGSLEHYKPRSRAQELIKERGGRVVTAVTGKTTHLLAGMNAGSKLDKAAGLGIHIVDEQEFTNLLSGDDVLP